MVRLNHSRCLGLALAAGSIVGSVGWSSAAAQQPTLRQQQLLRQQLTRQPQGAAISDGIVRVQASLPDEIRMGEQFTYRITATNATDSVTVHDLKLRQTQAEGFTIESTSMADQAQAQQSQSQQGQQQSGQQSQSQQGQQQSGQQQSGQQPQSQQGQQQSGQQQSGQQQSGQQKSGQQSGQQSDQQKSDQQKSDQQKSDQQKSDQQSGQQSGSTQQQASMSSGGQGKGTFDIGTLEPGQSKTLLVKAAADKEGQLMSCLEIVSYTPSICLTSTVVKPELQIVKTAPEAASLCEVIEVEYSVQNSGTGNIDRFEVIDQLPKGLVTIEGEDQLKFLVDGLPAGDVRKFVARLRAEKPGEYSSRAIAQATGTELKARSQQTTTRVESVDLQASIEGPSTLYSNQPAVFTARVVNSGNVAAEDVRVQVQWPADARLASLSEPQIKQASQSQRQASSSGSGEQVPQVAQRPEGSGQAAAGGQQRQGGQSADQSAEMAEQLFSVERLEPGQMVEFRYVVRPDGRDVIPTAVVAQYVCAAEDAAVRSEAPITAKAMASVEVLRLPALQIVTVDSTDPIASGEDVVYTVIVTNEGDAADKQVQLKTTLPDGLTFAEAKGPTDHSQEGSTVTFQPIETLEPGEDARYTVTAKVEGKGDVVFKAELKSESLTKPANAEEPTQLFAGQASSPQQ